MEKVYRDLRKGDVERITKGKLVKQSGEVNDYVECTVKIRGGISSHEFRRIRLLVLTHIHTTEDVEWRSQASWGTDMKLRG